jgi:large subunit ribosomal protein L35
MPKLKTNKSAAKRLRITKSGLLKRGSPGTRHFKRRKNAKRLRRLRKSKLVAKTEQRRMRRLLGLGG